MWSKSVILTALIILVSADPHEYLAIGWLIICELVTEAQEYLSEALYFQTPSSPVYFQDNFASLNGGAQIIMKSSAQIRNLNSILEDSFDKYMYTDEKLPIEIVIGLKEEIAIQSLSLRSTEMYSSIVKDFILEGRFALTDSQWVWLGRYQAKNGFDEQVFQTEQRVVRYIKMRILSSYGIWTYFTMTQVKVYGKGLFADAVSQTGGMEVCPKEYTSYTFKPDQQNVVTQLMQKIDRLQTRQNNALKELAQVQQKLKQLSSFSQREQYIYEEGVKSREQLFVVIGGLLALMLLLFGVVAFFYMDMRKELNDIRKKQ